MKNLLTVTVLLVGFQIVGFAQPPLANDSAWTRNEAIEQLELYPHDLYLQFVATQLSNDPRSRCRASLETSGFMPVQDLADRRATTGQMSHARRQERVTSLGREGKPIYHAL